MQKCKVCRSKQLKFLFTEKIINKYNCSYYECKNCRLIQTEEPFWLKESYQKSINNSDTGLMYRNLYFRDLTFIILNLINGLRETKNNSYLDFGGGYGIFVRLMRDIGLDFYWSDEYSANLLSTGFEDKYKNYNSIVAFEVFEHLQDPKLVLINLLKRSSYLIFSTELVPKKINDLRSWDYLGFNHGQHITFFQKETLDYLAKDLNLYISTDNKSIHILSRKKIDKNLVLKAKIIYKLKLFSLIKFFFKSKTYSDHKLLTK